MGKNVAVFVDVANIFYAAKAAGVDIDYVTLLKAAIAGRDFVRAYAYTGLDPDNENQRNFHSFLSRHGYKVVSKDIRKYGDGKVKANLDIELVVDMLKTARNLDVAIIVSGDGDFAPAIRAVQEMGVRVEVISFRGNTSSDLIEAADIFTDITALARVERSGRSGRRVADDEFDMSMTEVPDKQTEGSGRTRSRGGRGRGRPTDEPAREPVAASASRRGGRGRRDIEEPVRAADRGADRGVDRNGSGALVALPGEKLSGTRAGRGSAAAAPGVPAEIDEFEDIEVFADLPEPEAAAAGETDADGDPEGEGAAGEPRRRRRRGGRGRGRGRGREEGVPGEVVPVAEAPQRALEQEIEVEEDEEEPVAPRPPRPTPFGSIWDSQLGVPTAPRTGGLAPLPDDEDLEEPEVPEYLIAERRRGQQRQGGMQSGRGPNRGRGGGAYAAALDRERYGRGGGPGGTGGRFTDPNMRTGGGDPNLRTGGSGGSGFSGPGRGPARPPRNDRPERRIDAPRDRVERMDRPDRGVPPPQRTDRARNEEWSEVPPEIEELLRAQIASRPRVQGPAGGRVEAPAPTSGGGEAETVEPAVTRGRGRGRRPATPVEAEVAPAASASDVEATAVAAPRPTRGRPRKVVAVVPAAEAESASANPVAAADAEPASEAPRRGRRRTMPEAAVAAATEPVAPTVRRGRRPASEPTATEAPTPARRVTRARTAAADPALAEPAPSGEPTAPARRGRRKATEPATGE